MARARTDAEQQLADLLGTARRALRLSTAFVSRMDGTTQHLEVVDTSLPLLFKEGATQRQSTSFCQAIADQRLPHVIGDVRQHPEAMALPAARMPRIRSYVSVPIVLSDGSHYGTFCAAGLTTDQGLGPRDRHVMDVLAQAAAVIIEPSVREQRDRLDVESRVLPLLEGAGPVVHLQPIVDLQTGERVGAEALSRFPVEWGLTPDVVFAQAHRFGLGDRLELAALERAVGHLGDVDGYIALNVSPGTLLTDACERFLDRVPLDRVLLELSEHDAVEDYEAVERTLAPFRSRGLRLAIDDVGAGFSSLRHIVLTAPDVIKLDRTLVDGVAADTVLRSLVASLVRFAHDSDVRVVAEGIETADDAQILAALGVDLGQGWYFGRPVPPDALGARESGRSVLTGA